MPPTLTTQETESDESTHEHSQGRVVRAERLVSAMSTPASLAEPTGFWQMMVATGSGGASSTGMVGFVLGALVLFTALGACAFKRRTQEARHTSATAEVSTEDLDDISGLCQQQTDSEAAVHQRAALEWQMEEDRNIPGFKFKGQPGTPTGEEKELTESDVSFGDEHFTILEGTVCTIPEGTVSIGINAFFRCSSLTIIKIPGSVTSIGAWAFRGCTSLKRVTIPSSVTSIGKDAFRGCSSLKRVVIPSSVTSIDKDAFHGCSSLASVTINGNVFVVSTMAEWPAIIKEKVKTIVIPTSVTSIEDCAFKGCHSLTSVEIPTSVTSIGYRAFEGCSSLTSVAIPTSMTSIGVNLFRGCSSLASVEIPTSVTSIGHSAFWGCSSLASVAIPTSVTSIGMNAFEGCSSLASLAISTSSIECGTFEGIMDALHPYNGCRSITTVLVQPSNANDNAAGVDNSSDVWGRLFARFIYDTATNSQLLPHYDSGSDSDDDFYDPMGCLIPMDWTKVYEYKPPLPQLSNTIKIWAPDAVIAQLAGRFTDFDRFADVPRAFQAAPDATTWAGVQLWLWWLPPSSFWCVRNGNGNGIVDYGGGDGRVVCKSRATTIWTTMLSAYKSSEVLDLLPDLEPELWEHIFTFLKHDQQPVLPFAYSYKGSAPGLWSPPAGFDEHGNSVTADDYEEPSSEQPNMEYHNWMTY